MALNKNHEFEDLDGIRCGIVEKNVTAERLAFLKELLEQNGYTVVAVPSPPPKAAAAPPPKEGEAASPSAEAAVDRPETFTVGVTDTTFNWVNAIFGRQLKIRDGHIVTLAYWYQREQVSHDEIPYYEHE
jgi:hypothetical protein